MSEQGMPDAGRHQSPQPKRSRTASLAPAAAALAVAALLSSCASAGPDMLEEAQTVLQAVRAADALLVDEFGHDAAQPYLWGPTPSPDTLRFPFMPTRYGFSFRYSSVINGVDEEVALNAVRSAVEEAGFLVRDGFYTTPSGQTRMRTRVVWSEIDKSMVVIVTATTENMRLPRGYTDFDELRADWKSRFGNLAESIRRD